MAFAYGRPASVLFLVWLGPSIGGCGPGASSAREDLATDRSLESEPLTARAATLETPGPPRPQQDLASEAVRIDGAASQPRSSPRSRFGSPGQLPIEVELGTDEGEPLGLLLRPLDAAFTANDIAVLDASQPWIRVYSREGPFLRAMAREGGGPGEARKPYSLAATETGTLVLTHRTGIEILDSSGRSLRSVRGLPYALRGAVQGCGTDIVAFARPFDTLDALDARGVLLRIGPESAGADTFAVLDVLRQTEEALLMLVHPAYIQRTAEGIMLYTEERSPSRIAEFTCEGRSARDVLIDSLGRASELEFLADGRLIARGPRPPLPGGVGVVGEHVLWAVQVLDSLRTGVDSLTVFNAIGPDQTTHRFSVHGWFHLFDSDATGRLLLGNRHSLTPSVLVVDGTAMLRSMEVGAER